MRSDRFQYWSLITVTSPLKRSLLVLGDQVCNCHWEVQKLPRTPAQSVSSVQTISVIDIPDNVCDVWWTLNEPQPQNFLCSSLCLSLCCWNLNIKLFFLLPGKKKWVDEIFLSISFESPCPHKYWALINIWLVKLLRLFFNSPSSACGGTSQF